MAKDRVGILVDAEVGDVLAKMLKVSNRVQKLEENFKGVTSESKKLTKEQRLGLAPRGNVVESRAVEVPP